MAKHYNETHHSLCVCQDASDRTKKSIQDSLDFVAACPFTSELGDRCVIHLTSPADKLVSWNPELINSLKRRRYVRSPTLFLIACVAFLISKAPPGRTAG